ncbi:hypothetical protein [Vibrio bivalvicida]|uniref:Uncharacterized protein n=1 Tax=Vibrio bivalvicida TaxID=1276888 RepID=A0A177XYU9_9VIBR|nr:hypothetical protein [Vibrio bivalvicida]OAJ93536.1 hypothetical protein APB76_14350 [Vibrio bivalvicida]
MSINKHNEEIVNEIVRAFDEAGFNLESQRLKSFWQALNSVEREKKTAAAQSIIGYCHPKAWGDLSVAGKCHSYKSIQEWDKALAKLTKIAKNQLKHHKRNAQT